jgi:hypothetical protein
LPATTIANLNDNTVVNRRTNAKSGEEHHTFCKAIPHHHAVVGRKTPADWR